MYCTQALLPPLSAYFRISPTISALTVSLTTGMVALCIIPASMLSERYGTSIRVMLTSAVRVQRHRVVAPSARSLSLLIVGRPCRLWALAGCPPSRWPTLAEEVHACRSLRDGRYVAGTTLVG